MAITSRGYEGTVDYADWAVFATHMGGTYSVFGADAFPISAGSGDREVVIGAGEAAGAGILDTNSSPVTLAGASVTSGSRWDMVVLHREWGVVNATTIELVQGGSSKAIPTRASTPGQEDEQPLYLVRFTAGQTAVQEIVDLRVWRGDAGALVANDPMVRDYMNREGTEIQIGSTVWKRVLTGGVVSWAQQLPAWGDVTGKPSTFPNADVSGAVSDAAGMTPAGGKLAKFDANGFIRVQDPLNVSHPATKGYVDKRQPLSGSVVITPVANTPTKANITFPAGYFSKPPIVQVTPVTEAVGTRVSGCGVDNVIPTTTTGATIVLTRDNTVNTRVNWTAFHDNT